MAWIMQQMQSGISNKTQHCSQPIGECSSLFSDSHRWRSHSLINTSTLYCRVVRDTFAVKTVAKRKRTVSKDLIYHSFVAVTVSSVRIKVIIAVMVNIYHGCAEIISE